MNKLIYLYSFKYNIRQIHKSADSIKYLKIWGAKYQNINKTPYENVTKKIKIKIHNSENSKKWIAVILIYV